MLSHVLPFLIFGLAAAMAVAAMIATWRTYRLAASDLRDELATTNGQRELRYVTSTIGIKPQAVSRRTGRLASRPRLIPAPVRRAAA